MDRNNAFYEFFHNEERIGISEPKTEDFLTEFFNECKKDALAILGCLSYTTYNFILDRVKENKRKAKNPEKKIRRKPKMPLKAFYSSDYNFLVEYNFYNYETDEFNPIVLELVEKLTKDHDKKRIEIHLLILEIQRLLMYFYGYINLDDFVLILRKYEYFKDQPDDFIISVLYFNILFFHDNYISGNKIISYFIKDMQGFLKLREENEELDYKYVPIEELFVNARNLLAIIAPNDNNTKGLSKAFLVLPEPQKEIYDELIEEEKNFYDHLNEIVPKFYYKGYSITEVDELFSNRVDGKLN